jgi:hypothetical protein
VNQLALASVAAFLVLRSGGPLRSRTARLSPNFSHTLCVFYVVDFPANEGKVPMRSAFRVCSMVGRRFPFSVNLRPFLDAESGVRY